MAFKEDRRFSHFSGEGRQATGRFPKICRVVQLLGFSRPSSGCGRSNSPSAGEPTATFHWRRAGDLRKNHPHPSFPESTSWRSSTAVHARQPAANPTRRSRNRVGISANCLIPCRGKAKRRLWRLGKVSYGRAGKRIAPLESRDDKFPVRILNASPEMEKGKLRRPGKQAPAQENGDRDAPAGRSTFINVPGGERPKYGPAYGPVWALAPCSARISDGTRAPGPSPGKDSI